MTVLTNTRRREHPGNGVATIFSGPRVFMESQLSAYLVDDATGALTPLSTGSDYSVSMVGFADSLVTLTVPPPTGSTLLLLRTLPSQQPYSIKNQGAFFADIHEDALDYRAMFDQQLEDDISLAIRMPETALSTFNSELPQPTPGDALRPLVLNAEGNGIGFGDWSAGDLLLRPDLAGGTDVLFTRPNAGAVARGIVPKLREVISVEDFGVVGDGVTNDKANLDFAFARSEERRVGKRRL